MYGGRVMLGWRTWSGVGKYKAESPKQGIKRFNYITKTIHFADLVILFIYNTCGLYKVHYASKIAVINGILSLFITICYTL